ncbi:MAG TPA: hypothetical protein VHK90_16175 [Thermoanaerobaculia bacterium]|nr:hypothetical protein [Thermoanaerobaculia bacterium]
MTPKQRRLIFILAGLSGVVALGVFGFLVWMTFRNVTSPPKATGDDRRLVLTADALVPFGAPQPDPAMETLTAVKQIDGSRTIEYEYEPPFGTQNPRVTVSCTTMVHAHSLGARQAFHFQQLGTKGGMALISKHAKLVDAPQLLTAGDANWAAHIRTTDGQTTGTVFIMRQGRVIFTVIIGGLAFDKAEDANQLMAPLAAEAERRY